VLELAGVTEPKHKLLCQTPDLPLVLELDLLSLD